jgi:hypothetical protein
VTLLVLHPGQRAVDLDDEVDNFWVHAIPGKRLLESIGEDFEPPRGRVLTEDEGDPGGGLLGGLVQRGVLRPTVS